MYTILCMLCASSKSAKSDDVKMTEPTQVPYELYCNYVQFSSTIARVSLQAYIYIQYHQSATHALKHVQL